MAVGLYAVRLRELRRRRRMTRWSVARRINTTRSMIARYERGRARCPAAHRNALARLFGVSVPDLMS